MPFGFRERTHFYLKVDFFQSNIRFSPFDYLGRNRHLTAFEEIHLEPFETIWNHFCKGIPFGSTKKQLFLGKFLNFRLRAPDFKPQTPNLRLRSSASSNLELSKECFKIAEIRSTNAHSVTNRKLRIITMCRLLAFIDAILTLQRVSMGNVRFGRLSMCYQMV